MRFNVAICSSGRRKNTEGLRSGVHEIHQSIYHWQLDVLCTSIHFHVNYMPGSDTIHLNPSLVLLNSYGDTIREFPARRASSR